VHGRLASYHGFRDQKKKGIRDLSSTTRFLLNARPCHLELSVCQATDRSGIPVGRGHVYLSKTPAAIPDRTLI